MIWIILLRILRVTDHLFQMYSEAEYVALKATKKRSVEEQTRWQAVREERRRVQKMEANKKKRAGYSEEQKTANRERVRKQRA